MKLVVKSFIAIFRRPSIIIFLGIVIGLISIYSNMIVTTFGIAGKIGLNDGVATTLLDTLVTFVLSLNAIFVFLKDPMKLGLVIGAMVLGSIIFGGVLAVGFSGYFNTVFHALDKQKSKKYSFAQGIKMYFFKIWKANILFLLITIITAIVAWIAIVPFVTFLSAGAGYYIWGIILAVVTGIVLLFTVIYYTIYMSFWYPAIYTVQTSPFKNSKKLVDKNFLGVFLRILFVAIFFILVNALINLLSIPLGANFSTISMIVKWIFNTLFFAFVSTYVFALYRYLDGRANR